MIKLKVKETNTYPLLIHAPGHSSSDHGEIFVTLCHLLSLQILSLKKIPEDHDSSDLDVTIITWKGGPRYKNKDTLIEQFAKLYSIPTVILPYPDIDNFWEGTRHAKITLTTELLKQDIIKTRYFMYLDIGDVLWLESPKKILERYKEHFSGKIVFNAERNHYPKDDRLADMNMPDDLREKWNKVYEFDLAKESTSFRYLNSGMAIGEVSMLKDFMGYIVDENNCTGYHHIPHLVDTIPIKIAQYDNRDCVVTDDNCKLFLCLFNCVAPSLKHQELHMSDVEVSYTSY